jgi:hypothetical protein
MHKTFWWGNIMERDHFADLRVDWRMDIKMDLEIGQKVADWINLAQDRDRWWALANTDS